MPDIPKIDIRPDHWDIVRDILQKHVPHYAVWAFGSRAKWTAKQYSDLDLAIITDKPLSLDTSASLADDFSESDLPWKVDIVDWASTSESFKEVIERDKVVVQIPRRGRVMTFNDPVVRLGDYVEACLGKMLDAHKNRGTFQPYLGNSNVRWGTFDIQDLAVMRFEQQEEERYGLRDGDLVVCEGGEPGRCAIWHSEVPNMKIQKALHRIRVKDGLDNYFLYYWFLHAGKTGALEPYFTGTTIKHLTGRALAELKIPLPPIERQRGLAKVLRSLDDKIDLNHRINQTLEAMAQAIFKSWFVDFDPVKAKIAAIEQGQDPLRAAMCAISGKTDAELDQMPREHHHQLAATAALFPDAMEESELEEVPKGWNISKIETLMSRLSAKTRYTKGQVSEYGQIPVFEQGASILLGYHNRDAYYQASSENPIFIFGDHTCVTRLSCQPFDISQNVIPLKGKNRATAWIYYAVKEKQNFQEYRRHWMELISKDVVVAAADICLDFSKKITNIHLQIEENERQMQSLRELRDSLLPKLLSGELRVLDIEHIAEEV